MSFTVNNSANSNGGSTSQSVTISIAAGHTVVCVPFFDQFGAGGAITSITDSAGNTYTLGNSTTDGFGRFIYTGYSVAIASPITSVTAHMTGGTGGFVGLWVFDVSGSGTISFADTKALFTTPTTTGTDSLTSGVLTFTAADCLVLSAAVDLNSNSIATGTGFTADATGQNGSPSEHKAVTASAAATYTPSTAGDSALVAAVGLQIGGGGGGTTKNLTEQTATFAEGTPTASLSYALTGQTATFSEGVIAQALAQALTAQTATFSLGTITPAISYGVTGQTATFTEGTISASQGTVENLTGQTATFSIGAITPSISYAATGQTSTFTEGSLSPQAAYGLTGQTSTFSEGALTPAAGYAVTGLTATFAEGTITANAGGPVNETLTGLTASFSLGVITVTGADVTSGAGKHRKRYGVMDGWKLLLFNTKDEANAYRASMRTDIPAKKLKRIKTVEPAQVINLPELKRELPPSLVPQLDQMIRERRYSDIQDLSLQRDIEAQRVRVAKAKQDKDEQEAREATEREEVETVTHIVHAHRQASIEHIQSLHQALRMLQDIRRLRSIQ